MANIPSGPVADEYKRLTKEVKKVLHSSSMNLHFTNLGYMLQQKGLIKNPRALFSNLQDELIRAIINARIKEKK